MQPTAQLGLVDHAIALGQEQCAEAVAVHGAVLLRGSVVEEAGWMAGTGVALLQGDEELEDAGNSATVASAAGLVAAGEEGDAAQAGDGDVAVVVEGAEGAVVMLLGVEVGQAAVDGVLGGGVDHAERLPTVGQRIVVGEGTEG